METSNELSDNKIMELAKQNDDFARNFMKLHTPITVEKLPGRNDICPYCDSGLKFKYCECSKKHTKQYRNKYYL